MVAISHSVRRRIVIILQWKRCNARRVKGSASHSEVQVVVLICTKICGSSGLSLDLRVRGHLA